MHEEKFKDKFEGDDKDKIEKAVQEALDWLDSTQFAEKGEFEAKQKELEAIVNPFVMKVHQAAGGVLKDKFEGDGKDKIETRLCWIRHPPRSLVWRCEKKLCLALGAAKSSCPMEKVCGKNALGWHPKYTH